MYHSWFICAYQFTGFRWEKNQIQTGFDKYILEFIFMPRWTVQIVHLQMPVLCVCSYSVQTGSQAYNKVCEPVFTGCICTCYGGDSRLSQSCKPCLSVVTSRLAAYSICFNRQLGMAPLSTQVHTYPKACHVHLQEQKGRC